MTYGFEFVAEVEEYSRSEVFVDIWTVMALRQVLLLALQLPFQHN
jgi:hypothetical protein